MAAMVLMVGNVNAGEGMGGMIPEGTAGHILLDLVVMCCLDVSVTCASAEVAAGPPASSGSNVTSRFFRTSWPELLVFGTVSTTGVACAISSFTLRLPLDRRVVDVTASGIDRKSTRLNSSHLPTSRMPSSA